jgi:hypothetical protein
MMDGLLGLGASAATGGLFGVVGAAIGRVAGVLEQRETFRQERARWEHEEKLQELDLKAAAAQAESERAAIAARGSYAGLEASIAADARAPEAGYKWVEAVRSLVRPVLTVLLWLVYLAVFFAMRDESAAPGPGDETLAPLADYFVANVAFAATAATLWWFGDRAPRPPPLARGR